jgi:hypothetical protein
MSVYIHSAIGTDGNCFANLCYANERSPVFVPEWRGGGFALSFAQIKEHIKLKLGM